MAENNGSRKLLRENIRRILESKNPEDMDQDEEEQFSDTVGDWLLFEEFAVRLLDTIEYSGDYTQAIAITKQKVEEQDGWKFDEV